MKFVQKATKYIQFQINKHGQYCGHTTVEDVVKNMNPWELLELIGEAMDEEESEG